MAHGFRPLGGGAPVPCTVSSVVPTGSARLQTVYTTQSVGGYPLTVQSGFVTAPVSYPVSVAGTFRPVIPVAAQTASRGFPPVYQGIHHYQVTPGSVGTSKTLAGSTGSHISPHIPHGNQVADQVKFLEEQRRLEKERNFQVQQQRLKQFTVAGRKHTVNTDCIIESILGNVQEKNDKSVVRSHSPSPAVTPSLSRSSPIHSPVPHHTSASSCSSPTPSLQISSIESQKESWSQLSVDPSDAERKSSEALNNMMLECSDLSGPQKAKTFQKPLVKDIRPSSQQQASYVPSQKARDWKSVEGLDQVFILPKPRFPPWCCQEHVPPLYLQVQLQVSGENNSIPDTSLLYPILISSGLSREVLGHLWELCNQTSPGQLTQEEMYALLALISIAQVGHQISSTDILFSLPHPPVPILQCFNNLQQSGLPINTSQIPVSVDSSVVSVPNDSSIPDGTAGDSLNSNSIPINTVTDNVDKSLPSLPRQPSISKNIYDGRVENNSEDDSVRTNSQCSSEGAITTFAKSVASIKSQNPQESETSWTPFHTSVGQELGGSHTTTDDDFDDFKSATPPAISIQVSSSSGSLTSLPGVSSKSVLQYSAPDDDEFDEFQQASLENSEIHSSVTGIKGSYFNQSTICKSVEAWSLSSSENASVDKDLMSPYEDKYSVFRMLQNSDAREWGILENKNVLKEDDCVSKEDELNISETKIEECNIEALPERGELQDSKKDKFAASSEELVINNCSSLTESKHSSITDEDFGEFLDAGVTTGVEPAKDEFKFFAHPPEDSQSEINFDNFEKAETNYDDFDDFTSFQSAPIESSALTVPGFKAISDDDFGDFASSQAVGVKSEGATEFTLHFHHKDNISLAESQSVSSLELGTFDGGGHSGESKSSLSRHGSIPSLDLKGASLEGTDNEDGFGEMQSITPTVKISSQCPSPSFDVVKTSEEESSDLSSGSAVQHSLPVSLTDKYSVIRNDVQIEEQDRHVAEWLRCLHSCHDLLQNATSIFNQMSSSSVCNEVLSTEEGSDYIKNLIEVYRVVCRISLASKSSGKQTDELRHLLKDTEQAWNSLTVFFTGSSLMPEEAALDFTSGVLCPDPENTVLACGVCLLSVDARSKGFDREEDSYKLTYGGRQYHATCANLWVNCVDPLLPALPLPQLL